MLEFENGSWIEKVHYFPEKKTMLVFMKGNDNIYMCEGVEMRDYRAFESSSSRGTYFNQHIKGRFMHKWFNEDDV